MSNSKDKVNELVNTICKYGKVSVTPKENVDSREVTLVTHVENVNGVLRKTKSLGFNKAAVRLSDESDNNIILAFSVSGN